MQINGNTLTLDDGHTIALPKYPTASRVKVWRVPVEYRADGVFVSITGPGLAAEDIPACNLADCTVIGELDYPADEGAALAVLRAERLALASQAVDAVAFSVVNTPDVEKLTWPAQEMEAGYALSYAQYFETNGVFPDGVEFPVLTALIASRGMGETVLQLAEKVMRNVAAYRQMASPLVGWWYGVKARLAAATTAEEVMAVVVYPPIGG